MNPDIVRMDAEDAHAAPYRAEIRRLLAKLDEATRARDEALHLAETLAGRVAHEHRQRSEAEKVLRAQWESSTESERMRLIRLGMSQPRR